MKKIILSIAIVLLGCCSYAQNTFPSNGNVGIGTSSPGATLQIDGTIGIIDGRNLKLSYPGGGALANTELSGLAHLSSELGLGWTALYAKQGSASYAAVFNGTTYFTGGNVGIGTTSPTSKFDIYGNNERLHIGSSTGDLFMGQWDAVNNRIESTGRSLYFTTYTGAINFGISGNTSLSVANTGNVLIGQTTQTNTNYKLEINGSARANEMVVNTTGADFVFDNKYHLRKLSEIKAYIDKNHHLPEVPSANEMKANGLELGEMNKKLLQKVEELTLYLIDKDKQLTEQQTKLFEQQKKSNEQEARISALEKALSKKASK